MPICNMCEKEFDVEDKPGALMFGHPHTVKDAVPVWKAHICQECETIIVDQFARKPRYNQSYVEDSAEMPVLGKTYLKLSRLHAIEIVKVEEIETSHLIYFYRVLTGAHKGTTGSFDGCGHEHFDLIPFESLPSDQTLEHHKVRISGIAIPTHDDIYWENLDMHVTQLSPDHGPNYNFYQGYRIILERTDDK